LSVASGLPVVSGVPSSCGRPRPGRTAFPRSGKEITGSVVPGIGIAQVPTSGVHLIVAPILLRGASRQRPKLGGAAAGGLCGCVRGEDPIVMQIGEVAARVGLSLRTIRHWDEMGLVVPSERSAGGFRLYTEADIDRLALVKTLKPLDFSLEQMRDLLDTMDGLEADTDADTDRTAELLRRLAVYRAATDSRVEALRAQVQGLELLSRELRRLANGRTPGRRG
jgi:DNA-binding transcriptional MerR regulator